MSKIKQQFSRMIRNGSVRAGGERTSGALDLTHRDEEPSLRYDSRFATLGIVELGESDALLSAKYIAVFIGRHTMFCNSANIEGSRRM